MLLMSTKMRRKRGRQIIDNDLGRDDSRPVSLFLVNLGIFAVSRILKFSIITPFADDSVHGLWI